LIGSVLLHVLVLLGAFLHVLLSSLQSEPKPHVFELVSEVPPSPTPPRPQPTAPEPSVSLELPNLKPVPTIEKPVIPPPPEPPPPAPPPPPRDAPTPQPPKRELIDIRNHVPSQTQTTTRTTRPTVATPTINAPQIRAPQVSTPRVVEDTRRSQALTAQEQNLLAQYGARLRERINQAWNQPDHLDGQLQAVAEIQVNASGRITNIRFNPGSGNRTFDASVRAAIEQVGSAGATPTGDSHTFSMTFRMVDR
jgi:TonB family protein